MLKVMLYYNIISIMFTMSYQIDIENTKNQENWEKYQINASAIQFLLSSLMIFLIKTMVILGGTSV